MERWAGLIEYFWQGKLQSRTFGLGETSLQEGLTLIFESEAATVSEIEPASASYKVRLRASSPVVLRQVWLETEVEFRSSDKIYCNGYQSWTASREFHPDEAIPQLRVPFPRYINTSGDYTFYPNHGAKGFLHSYTWSHLRNGRSTILFTDQIPHSGYLIVEWRCPENKVRLLEECAGREVKGAGLILHAMEVRSPEKPGRFDPEGPDPMLNRIAEKALAYLGTRPSEALPGWTSWYNHYTRISEKIVRDNLQAFFRLSLPIRLFQIDDGWQPAIGDWTTSNDKFPSGMAALASEIKAKGYLPGLWLAPFIVEKKSAVYREHPEWLLTYDGERPVAGGYNPGWGGLFRGTYHVLDLENEEVRAHLKNVFRVVLEEWGFELVKLDFLFVAALIPKNGKCRGQRMAEAMALLRECCGDKLILGCGVPLGPSFGQVDYCRIGPDIGLNWDGGPEKATRLRERISTRNALVNSINRRFLDGRAFGNDPDVFILREGNNRLELAQQRTLFILNAIFGKMLLHSDNPGKYSAETLELYRSVFPMRHPRILEVDSNYSANGFRIWFEVNGREYLAFARLDKGISKMYLPNAHWYLDGRFVQRQGALVPNLYATQIALKINPEACQVAGGDQHLFPGAGVEQLEFSENELRIEFHPEARKGGTIWVNVPQAGDEVSYRGRKLTVVNHETGLRFVEIQGGND